jgi:hypothetical protein
MRRLTHYYTSWTAQEDKDGQYSNNFPFINLLIPQEAVPVARLLAQTLSNMIVGNEFLTQRLWEIYINHPEDQSILM